MGQQDEYLGEVDWDDSLTLEERIARGPFQSAFAIGRSGNAAAAIEHAHQQVVLAAHVLNTVQEQAVFAHLVEGMSVREIASTTGLSKSEVGRIAKHFERRGGEYVSHPNIPPAKILLDDVRARIRAAWGHE